MRTPTFGEIDDKVTTDLDLQNETFVSVDERVGYFNEAIREAEAEIAKLGLDETYFLKSASLALVQGTSAYAMPTDIYINKIRSIIYANGTIIYPIRQIRRMRKFLDAAFTTQFGQNEYYRYLIQNTDSTNDRQIVLFPASRETGSSLVTIWYIRDANRVPLTSEGSLTATRATKVDIPEFQSFLMQFVKCRIYEKEGNPNYDSGVAVLQQQRKMMVDTLTQMIPDDDDEIEQDLTSYEDMV